MALSVLEMVLPIVLLLGLGTLCRQRRLLTPDGLAGVKSVVSGICLPVVLFNAFFTAHYSLSFCWALPCGPWPPPMAVFSPFCSPAPRAVCWAMPCTAC